jgi:hypothetical protein
MTPEEQMRRRWPCSRTRGSIRTATTEPSPAEGIAIDLEGYASLTWITYVALDAQRG